MRVTQREPHRVCEFARAHSPFYRDAWRELPQRGIVLANLPVVTKRQLMERFDDWVTDPDVDRAGVETLLVDRTHIGERYHDRYVVVSVNSIWPTLML